VAGAIVPDNVCKYAQKKGLYVLVPSGNSLAVAAAPRTLNLGNSKRGGGWTVVADTKFGSDDIYAITYDGGKFIAVGTDDYLAI
jgi:hypothetical protein